MNLLLLYTGGATPCENVTMTGDWQPIDMRHPGTILPADDIDDDFPMCDLVSSGDVIAIIADDVDEDYYLMKVPIISIHVKFKII